jgi:DNA-binding transcriptional MerR regulator
MFKIGDFSQLGQVSVRMLRHYDELGLLKPAHVDPWTEYRYYTIGQLPRLHRILALKDLGLPLDQIGTLLDDDVPLPYLRRLLQQRQTELDQQIQAEQARLTRVAARLQELEEEGKPSPYDVIVKRVDAITLVSARVVVPTLADMPPYRHRLSEELYGWLDQHHVKPSGPELVFYHIPEFVETNIDLEFGIIVPPSAIKHRVADAPLSTMNVRELPEVAEMAYVVHSGMIHDIPHALTALYRWVGTHGYTSSGAYREVHVWGRETDSVNIEPIVVELQLPIARI